MAGQTENSSGLRGAVSGFVVVEDADKIERARLAVAKASADLKQNVGVAMKTLREARSRVVSHTGLQTMSGMIGLVGMMMSKPRALSAPWPVHQGVSRQKMLMLGLCGLSFLAAVFLPERSVKTPAEILEAASSETAHLKPIMDDEGAPRVTPAVFSSAEPLKAMPAPVAEPVLALRDDIQPHWLPVRRPIPIYHLEAPDVEISEMDYQVAARGKTARQDRLIWTPRAGSETRRGRITLIIERFEAHAGTERPLLADMAQRAADQHFSIERLSQPAEIATKFGAMQVADGAFSSNGITESCTVFRRIDMSGVTIAGWYCPPASRPLDRVRLSCFLNRLNLMSAGNDQGLRSFFTKADLNRLPCVSSKQAGRKTTWMDHEAPMPPLKLSGKTR